VKTLNDALGSGPSGNSPVEWSAARAATFKTARSAMAASALLDHPAAGPEISLVPDASASHIGAVLKQRRRGQGWRPLAFFSQKLSPTQACYSASDCELLAGHDSIVHFCHLLEGRSFIVFSDHLPLVGALHQVLEPKSDCQRRQLSFIAEFTGEIRHIAGQSNVVADALSRPAAAGVTYADVAAGRAASSSCGPQAGVAVTAATAGLRLQPGGPLAAQTVRVAAAGLQLPSSSVEQLAGSQAGVRTAEQGGGENSRPPLDVADIAEAQPACLDCRRAVHVPSLKLMSVMMGGKQLLVDTSSGVMRPLVPLQFRCRLFKPVHNLAHPGIRATKRFINRRYLWPNLAKDVAEWCRSCQRCQCAKITKQPPAPVQPISVPTTRFSHVHVDLVFPLPCSSDGSTYFLKVVDRSTRWAEALPLKATSAAECASAFVAGWIARFGVPSNITSDRGCSSLQHCGRR
jgi:RNase H-like domain found in reverse transcriptase/Integrase zinc binding domain